MNDKVKNTLKKVLDKKKEKEQNITPAIMVQLLDLVEQKNRDKRDFL